VACELCNKKQEKCSRVAVFQRWRVAKFLGITEERLDVIAAAVDKQQASPRHSKRRKPEGTPSGLKLRLPPQGRKNTSMKTRAQAREVWNVKGTEPGSSAAPETSHALGVRHNDEDDNMGMKDILGGVDIIGMKDNLDVQGGDENAGRINNLAGDENTGMKGDVDVQGGDDNTGRNDDRDVRNHREQEKDWLSCK
jgi:hypothetical protein